MGPHTSDIDPLFSTLRRLRELQRNHPEAIVTSPSESRSGLWELSLPDSSAVAVDSVERLVALLERLEDRLD